ncbi:16999_t:CDS:1, partial [Acaulospora colombiana]
PRQVLRVSGTEGGHGFANTRLRPQMAGRRFEGRAGWKVQTQRPLVRRTPGAKSYCKNPDSKEGC